MLARRVSRSGALHQEQRLRQRRRVCFRCVAGRLPMRLRASSARSRAGLGWVSRRVVTALAIGQAAASGLASSSSSTSGSGKSGSCGDSSAVKCAMKQPGPGRAPRRRSARLARQVPRCPCTTPSRLEDAAVARNSSSLRLVRHASMRPSCLITTAVPAVARRASAHVRRDRGSAQLRRVHVFPPVAQRVPVDLQDERSVVDLLAQGLSVAVYRTGFRWCRARLRRRSRSRLRASRGRGAGPAPGQGSARVLLSLSGPCHASWPPSSALRIAARGG